MRIGKKISGLVVFMMIFVSLSMLNNVSNATSYPVNVVEHQFLKAWNLVETAKVDFAQESFRSEDYGCTAAQDGMISYTNGQDGMIIEAASGEKVDWSWSNLEPRWIPFGEGGVKAIKITLKANGGTENYLRIPFSDNANEILQYNFVLYDDASENAVLRDKEWSIKNGAWQDDRWQKALWSVEEWHTYFIVSTDEGCAMLYYLNENNDNKYGILLDNAEGGAACGANVDFSLQCVNGSSVQVKEITAYTEIPLQEPAVFTAGSSGTKIIPNNGEYTEQHAHALRALVNPNIADGKLFVAAYDIDGRVLNVAFKDIKEHLENEKYQVVLNVSDSRTAYVRAFLWDDNFSPITEPRVIYPDASSVWYRQNEWVQNGTVLENKILKQLILAPGTQEEAVVTNLGGIGESYDVSWDMQINTFSGNELVQIANGIHRLMLYFDEDGIEYHAYNSVAEDGYTVEKLSCDIGEEVHHYRVVGTGEICKIYVDDMEIGVVKPEKNARVAPRVDMVSADGGKVVLDNVSIETETGDNQEDEQEKSNPFDLQLDFLSSSEKEQFLWYGDWSFYWGTLRGRSSQNNYEATIWKVPDYGDDFTYQANIKFSSHGVGAGIQIIQDTTMLARINFYEDYLSCNNKNVEIDLSDNSRWHQLKVESYQNKTRYNIYVDDVLVIENIPVGTDQVDPREEKNYCYMFVRGTESDQAEVRIDSMGLKTKVYSGEMILPYMEEEYSEGQKINLFAKPGYKMQDPPYLEYKINGKTVATGLREDGYKAVLENLPVGEHEVMACYGDFQTPAKRFSVISGVNAELDVVYKEGSIEGKFIQIENGESIAEVEYRLDGVTKTKQTEVPFETVITDVTEEGHTLTAICRDNTGKILFQTSKKIIPSLSEQMESMNYANEISYDVVGDSGEAIIVVNNANHLLRMKHTLEGVYYQTKDGELFSEEGLGKFQILTDGPFVDVYRNGKLAFSYLMPTNKSGINREVIENGLEVNDFEVSIPENRCNYVVLRNLTGQSEYEIPELISYHNLDFIVEKGDAAQLGLNDGYFWTKIEIEDDTLYAWTVDKKDGVPYRKEITKISEQDGVYYRVETAAGMSRLYANGEWLASFRGVSTLGKPKLDISVEAGDGLSYLSVNEYSDIYLYEDMGEFDSLEYWRYTNTPMEMSLDGGVMKLNAANKENAVADFNVYVGNAKLSADVELTHCNGGFWFILNHSLAQRYSKIGYNAVTECYELVDANSDNLTTPELTCIKQVPGNLPIGQKVHMELQIDSTDEGKKVTLFVDGNPVLVHNDTLFHRGSIGFLMSHSVANVSNVSYRGDAKPVPTLTDLQLPHGNITTLDMVEGSDADAVNHSGDVINMVSFAGAYTSSNGGKSWGPFSLRAEASNNLVELGDGRILSINEEYDSQTGARRYYAAITDDMGQTWSKLGYLMEDFNQGRTVMSNRVTKGAYTGRIYFVTGESKDEDFGVSVVHYSDDDGVSWNSGSPLDAKELGFCIQEGRVVELSPALQQLWFRNELGYLCYLESHDQGVTWDPTPHQSPLFSALNCYNVEQDPDDPQTLYAAWGYNNANLGESIQEPRNRMSVARSTDGGMHWEYIGTVHEDNAYANNMMNMSINVGKKYVVVNASSRVVGKSATANAAEGPRILTIAKGEQTATKRFEQVHMERPNEPEETRVVDRQTEKQSLAVHTQNNSILFRGECIKDAASGDAVKVEYAAKLVGATVENNDNGVVFRCGDAQVSFGMDAVSADKKYIDCTAFANEYGLKVTLYEDILVIAKNKMNEKACRSYMLALDLLMEFN